MPHAACLMGRWRSSGVEQLICNQLVGGSNPLASSSSGEIPKRSTGPDCKSGGIAFGGSNPPLPTSFHLWYSVIAERGTGVANG